jgi:hypothetical protein
MLIPFKHQNKKLARKAKPARQVLQAFYHPFSLGSFPLRHNRQVTPLSSYFPKPLIIMNTWVLLYIALMRVIPCHRAARASWRKLAQAAVSCAPRNI